MSWILDECALKVHYYYYYSANFHNGEVCESSLSKEKKSNTRAAVTQHTPVHQLVDEVVLGAVLGWTQTSEPWVGFSLTSTARFKTWIQPEFTATLVHTFIFLSDAF